MTLEESIYIERSAEAVYALVRDLERAPEWQDSLVSVDVDAGTEVRQFAGRRATARFFILDDDPPRRLAIRSEGKPADVRAEFVVDPDGDGCRVTFVIEVQLKGAARFAGGIVRPAVERETRGNLQRLKELLEA